MPKRIGKKLCQKDVAQAILDLCDGKGGSRYIDIMNIMGAKFGRAPHFLDLKEALIRGMKDGIYCQNSNGRFKLTEKGRCKYILRDSLRKHNKHKCWRRR